MNCDCVEKVNKKLKDAGYEYRLATAIVFDDRMNAALRLEIPTVWNDPLKRRKKAPPGMLCTLCPFCGTSAIPMALCSNCGAAQTTADIEAGACTQCQTDHVHS